MGKPKKKVRNKKIPKNKFLKMRKAILEEWCTGEEVDINEALDYHKKLKKSKIAPKVIKDALTQGKILISPRAGIPRLPDHIKLLRSLVKNGADLAPTSIDSYTRHARYSEIEKVLNLSTKKEEIELNGFPVVNYGVKGVRKVVESINVPINLRAATGLSAEIALAGGITYLGDSTLHRTIAYRKLDCLDEAILKSQYTSRLIGMYIEQGAEIWNYARTGYTGTMVPPCLQIVTGIFEAFVAAEQGIKNFSLCCSQSGNIFQDIAVLDLYPSIAEEYLGKHGYNINFCTEYSHYTAAFPPDKAKAFAIIDVGTLTAVLGKATIIMIKSTEEGFSLPRAQAQIEAMRATKQVIRWLQRQYFTHLPEDVLREKTQLTKEVKAILDRIFEIGDGDIIQGMIKAFEIGVMDIPFSPNVVNANKLVPIRDAANAIRILDPGNLPFNSEIMDYHKKKIAEREKIENCKADYEMLISDVLKLIK